MAQVRRLSLIGLVLAAAMGAAGCLCSQIAELDPSVIDDGGQTEGPCRLDTDCADEIDCTQDLCADDGNCRHFADDTTCSDDEICFPQIGCVPRHPCESVEDCQDDNVCNGEESCVDNFCRPGEPVECDDGDFCNGTEVCDPIEGCRPGEPPSCSDGIDCTTDGCANGECTHVPDDSVCADGKACNGSEVCDPVQGCLTGARACDDGVDCTEDECVEPAGTCLHHANHLLCGPGQICDGTGCRQQQCADASDCDDQDFCNGVETCNAEGICEPGDRVVCDDGVFCNGTEYCQDGTCASQDPPGCADGIACTTDACDLVSDTCVHLPNHASCADGSFCNGEELCGALGCAAGPPPDCDDGDACTVESCVEGDGCASEPRDRDADGSGDAACGGDDCNDLDPFSHPGAAEICNELDDDCDGTIDEGFDCRQDATGSCTTACGTTGSRTCTAACAWGACAAPPEDCNGRDDDCDGVTDEGCQCSPQDPTTCRTDCGTTGSRTCVNGAWTACTPPAETCNGIDDDCRGGVDDGFALHFTGDMHAVTSAHNLLAALLDNTVDFRTEIELEHRQVLWRRVLDMNDRFLRRIVIGLGGRSNGVPREDAFDITAASEVMAILCLARDVADLKQRLGRILVGFDRTGQPVTADRLRATGAMASLLYDAILPNLVQTTEGVPAFVHGGPFGNIAHGCNSVMATTTGAACADYLVTEAGFGFDLGAEKFFDIKCRAAGIWPSAVVLVVTVRALRFHGGDTAGTATGAAGLEALARGLANLDQHVNSVRAFGFDPVIAINCFESDSEEELTSIERACAERQLLAARCRAFAEGGAGGEALAEVVVAATLKPNPGPRFLYDLAARPEDKVHAVATRIYGAQGIVLSRDAENDIARLTSLGYGSLPICVAKTHLSLSDDPGALGRPQGFDLTVRQVRIAAGAGYLLALTGEIVTMPGLPKTPAAHSMDLAEDGTIIGVV